MPGRRCRSGEQVVRHGHVGNWEWGGNNCPDGQARGRTKMQHSKRVTALRIYDYFSKQAWWKDEALVEIIGVGE